MPRKSGLKRKKIEAGDPPFIPEGKPPEPADNSAAGSLFEVRPERLLLLMMASRFQTTAPLPNV